jgi:hypothetical protein
MYYSLNMTTTLRRHEIFIARRHFPLKDPSTGPFTLPFLEGIISSDTYLNQPNNLCQLTNWPPPAGQLRLHSNRRHRLTSK